MAGLVIPVTLGVVFSASAIEIIASVLLLWSNLLLAKAKPEGYILYIAMIVFYSLASFWKSLYGEVVVNLAISLPLVMFGLIRAYRNRCTDELHGQIIKINKTSNREFLFLAIGLGILGVVGYFILGLFDTAFLVWSTLALVTAALGEYLVARRSHLGVGGFIINDILSIVLWSLILSLGYTSAVPLIAAYGLLLVNDIYGVMVWRKLRRRQNVSNDSNCCGKTNNQV